MGWNLVFAGFGYADKAVRPFCRTLGLFLPTSAGQILASAQKFFVKPRHFMTEIAQPCD
jgi:hypothetical protein